MHSHRGCFVFQWIYVTLQTTQNFIWSLTHMQFLLLKEQSWHKKLPRAPPWLSTTWALPVLGEMALVSRVAFDPKCYICTFFLTGTDVPLSSSHPRCQKGSELKGRRPQPLQTWRSRRPRRWSISCLRRGPRIWASEGGSDPEETSPTLSNGPLHLAAAAKGYSL